MSYRVECPHHGRVIAGRLPAWLLPLGILNLHVLCGSCHVVADIDGHKVNLP